MVQIHYVVVYDTDTGKWKIDDDTTIAKFNYENAWDELAEEWVTPEDELWDEENEAVALLVRLFENQ